MDFQLNVSDGNEQLSGIRTPQLQHSHPIVCVARMTDRCMHIPRNMFSRNVCVHFIFF